MTLVALASATSAAICAVSFSVLPLLLTPEVSGGAMPLYDLCSVGRGQGEASCGRENVLGPGFGHLYEPRPAVVDGVSAADQLLIVRREENAFEGAHMHDERILEVLEVGLAVRQTPEDPGSADAASSVCTTRSNAQSTARSMSDSVSYDWPNGI